MESGFNAEIEQRIKELKEQERLREIKEREALKIVDETFAMNFKDDVLANLPKLTDEQMQEFKKKCEREYYEARKQEKEDRMKENERNRSSGMRAQVEEKNAVLYQDITKAIKDDAKLEDLKEKHEDFSKSLDKAKASLLKLRKIPKADAELTKECAEFGIDSKSFFEAAETTITFYNKFVKDRTEEIDFEVKKSHQSKIEKKQAEKKQKADKKITKRDKVKMEMVEEWQKKKKLLDSIREDKGKLYAKTIKRLKKYSIFIEKLIPKFGDSKQAKDIIKKIKEQKGKLNKYLMESHRIFSADPTTIILGGQETMEHSHSGSNISSKPDESKSPIPSRSPSQGPREMGQGKGLLRRLSFLRKDSANAFEKPKPGAVIPMSELKTEASSSDDDKKESTPSSPKLS